MSIAIPNFWKLVIESRLLTPEQCQLLGTEYGRVKGAAQEGNSKTLSQWLISKNALTAYQAAILEAGRSGPFHYGDYKVYDRVADGIFAGSFRAIHEPASHPVLLRFVTGDATSDAAKWAELVSRIQSHSAIVHPNLNRCFEAVDLSSYKFVAIEDIQGKSLDQQVPAGKALRSTDACRIIRQAAMGLAAMHQSGMIHGDIRPSCMWFDAAGNIVLVRDPLYEPIPLHLAQTDASSQLLVRADYMAPELAQQGETHDAVTDIYALGCTLYQLLTGQPPFAGGDVMQKLQRHAAEAIQPLEQFGVPQPLAQLVAYMMAKNPQVRYQQPAVVAEQISQFVDPAQLNIQPPVPPQSLTAYENWIRQKQATLATHAPAPAVQESFPSVADSGKTAAAAPVVSVDTGVGTAGTVSGAVKPATSRSGSSSVTSRYQPRKMSTKNWIMIGSSAGGVLVFALLLVIVLANMGGNETDGGDNPGTNEVVENSGEGSDNNQSNGGDKGSEGEAETTNGSITLVQVDDPEEKMLWAPPTLGSGINAAYVPELVRILFTARPAEILATSGGAEILKSLGPKFSTAHESWQTAVGVPMSEVEHVLIGLHDVENQPRLVPSFIVTLANSVDEKELAGRWGNLSTETVNDSAVSTSSNGWSYFILPPDEEAEETGVKRFVMGSKELVSNSAERGNTPPLFRREMKALLLASDDERHFNVLFTPDSLFDEKGEKLFENEFAKALDPIDWLLGSEIQAGMVSMHFGQGSYYIEMRMKSNIGTDSIKLANQIRDRLEQIPGSIERYIATLNPPAYWRMLANRFPAQIRYLHDYTRVGVDDKQAVINAILPPTAAPNLLAGSELVISSAPGATSAVATTAPKIASYDELLRQKYDFAIDSDDMVNVVASLRDEIPDTFKNISFKFGIRIIGGDLELDGITKNQRINEFKMEGKTLAEVMTGIVMKAQGTNDPTLEDKQKLIWVVGPDPDTREQKILLTTRKQAAVKKYTVPAVFSAK